MKEAPQLHHIHMGILENSSLPDIAGALVQRAEIELGKEQSAILPLNQNSLYAEAESPFSKDGLVCAALNKISRTNEAQLDQVVSKAIQLNAVVYEANPTKPIPAEVALNRVGYAATQKREALSRTRLVGEAIRLAIESNIPGL